MMVRAKQFSIAGLLCVAGATLGGHGALAMDDPAGYWATENNESQIKITHCGTDAICGSIFWMKEPNDGKGNPKLDRKNADEAKRKHPLLGLQLIDMKSDDDRWKGTVYNPENGKTYSATLKNLSKNEVELEGCVAYVLCGDQKWKREEPRVPPVTGANVAHPAKVGAGASTAPSE